MVKKLHASVTSPMQAICILPLPSLVSWSYYIWWMVQFISSSLC